MKTMYRIFATILCIGALPVIYFLPLIRINISSGLASSLMSNLGISEYNSIHSIVKAASGSTQSTLFSSIIDAFTDSESAIGKMLTNRGYLYAFIVFFVLMVVLLLVTAGFAAFSKKYTVGLCLSVGTLISVICMNKCFDAFAKPLVSGQIGLGSLLSSADSTGLLSSLLGSAVEIKYLQLGAVYQSVLIIAAVVTILAVCAIVDSKSTSK